MFNVNFSYIIRALLPTRLRKSRIIAFLLLLSSGVRKVWDYYIEYRAYLLFDINFTGQVIYLEKKLSDLYGCEIRIEDGGYIPTVYIYNKDENYLPIYMLNEFILGDIHVEGEVILCNNIIYSYNGTGSGDFPYLDSNATVFLTNYDFLLANRFEDNSMTDFIIMIPSAVYITLSASDFSTINKIVNFYRLYNKSFNIISY